MQASSIGASGSVTSDGSDNGKANQGGGKGAGPGGANLMNVGASGTGVSLPAVTALSSNDVGTTRSGIGAGTVVIGDDVAQRAAAGKGAQDSIADINRDVTTGGGANGRIGNNFDLAATQATLNVTSAFTTSVVAAATPVAAKLVGDIGTAKEKEAFDKADAYTDLAAAAKRQGNAQAEKVYLARASDALAAADAWGDIGLNRIALHARISFGRRSTSRSWPKQLSAAMIYM